MPSVENVLRAGFGPLLGYLQSLGGPPISSEVAGKLKAAELTARVLAGKQREAVQELLADDSFPNAVVALKGAATALLYYPQPYLRTMGDIDLLVRSEDLPASEASCLALGYIYKSHLPQAFYRDHHHAMPLYHPATGAWLELHTALFPTQLKEAGEPVFSDSVIRQECQRAIPSETKPNETKPNETKLYGLSRELELVYTCAHWGIEPNWTRSAIRLMDIALMLRDGENSLDWEKIFQWLRQSPRTAVYVYLALAYLHRRDVIALSTQRLAQLQAIQGALNRINEKFLMRFIDNYMLAGQAFGRVLSINVVYIIWSTLVNPYYHPWYNLLIRMPLSIVFPRNNNAPNGWRFQLSRLAKLITRR